MSPKQEEKESSPGRSLSSCPEGNTCRIIANQDKKTLELGLFAGARIMVLKNAAEDTSLVVAVGDSRYMIPREVAGQIRIK